MRNIGSISNYEGPIEYTVEVKLFYRGHKESVILGILWLVCYNLEINQKTEKVKITRCLDECRKQWKMKQTKLEWQKQKEKEQNKDFRKPTVEKKIEITRIIEKKQKEKKDLIQIRTVEEIVLRRFHKYLKMFEKKKLERILIRKTWNHAIDFRKDFVLKRRRYICY